MTKMENVKEEPGSARQETDLDAESYVCYRIMKTLYEMLHDRGYLVAQQDLNFTPDEFVEKYGEFPSRESLTIVAQHKDSQKTIQAYFIVGEKEKKIGVSPIRDISEQMARDGIDNAIIILKYGLTPSAKNEVNAIGNTQWFVEKELVVNLTRHTRACKHEVISDHEKRALLAKYKIKESQLPRILLSDPMAKYLGLELGQVVKIYRPGNYKTFRIGCT